MNNIMDFIDKRRTVPDVFTCTNKSGHSMNYAHINARSIPAHIDELTHLLASYNIHVFGVCETFLRKGSRCATFNVNGYQIFRNDRVGANGGGVALYVRKGIKAKIVSRSELNRVEYIMVELYLCAAKLLVGVFYIPPPTSNTDVDNFCTAITQFSVNYPHCIFMGDFNINILNPLKSKYYLSALSTLSLCYIPFRSTRLDSLLDHFLVPQCNASRITRFSQMSMPGISDHDLLLMTYSHRIPKPTVRFKLIRDLSGIDSQLLVQKIYEVPWNTVFSMTDCNAQVAFLTDAVNSLFNYVVPVKRVIDRDPTVPCFNSTILYWMKKRDEAYLYWRETKSSENRQYFGVLRNKVVRLIRDAKRRFYCKKFERVKNSSQAWLMLKNLGYSNSFKQECNYSPEYLNSQFVSVERTTPSLPLPSVEGYQENERAFNFIGVSEDEVYRAFYSISSDSAGIDGVSLNFIKMILPSIVSVLTHIFNFCIMSCTIPDMWKKAAIIPVPKKLSVETASDYRPISLLPIFSKALEILLRNQMQTFLDENNLLSQHQSGFRKLHSTTTALAKVSFDVMQSLNSSKFTVLVLLDFSKAFDSVDHQLLCQKLFFDFGFSHQSVRLISSYLYGRSQAVRVEDATSSFIPTVSGVPQGSILGPLLFSIFINDLPNTLISSSCHLYADDCQLYISGKLESIESTFNQLNADLLAVSKWSKRNGLILNSKKTQAIVISRAKLNIILPTLILNGKPIDFCDTVRNLGVIFNSTLNWSDHISLICNKVYYALYSLRQLNFYTPEVIKMLLVRSLIIPFFLYCDILFYNADFNSRRHLQVAFNSCIRYIHNLRRYDHVSSYSNSILGAPLFSYLKFRTCCFIYKLILTQRPEYLASLMSFGQSPRTFNITSLSVRESSRQFSASMFVNGFSLFNMLPLEIKRAGSLGVFKSSCFTWFQNNG